MATTEIRVGGLGGQGVILCASIIGKCASIYSDKHATLIQAFGPEARGSACSAQVIISDEVIGYPYVKNPDVLVLMSQDAYTQFIPQLKPGGTLLYESDLVHPDIVRGELPARVARDVPPGAPRAEIGQSPISAPGKLPNGATAIGIPATRLAEELGRRLVLNIVMVGFFAGVTKLLPYEAVEQAVRSTVPKGTEDLNLRALKKGYDFGSESIAN